ncbi:hypothetical protein A3B84_00640 [Candidatus Nomurabacteria bacterium RIFCSPHIGHO2_02_FULL_35_13]|uniref:Uncharacterized protein n=1 Tax=Candidatus Nomurabacteria bacterium RIFCSPHIGHO2_02_FULL_35_13 TaxID=1801748 RepID=A0A1F6VNV3_9BACT|nr:MAG: hypothetical protein A3B84_00640 [Candidatus Nomurabacteria bacterium RIFCSPHIGHO2_02_FULL_35_13]
MQFLFQKKSLTFSIILFVFSCFVFLFLYSNINNNKKALQLAQEKWQVEAMRRENARSLANSIKAIESEKILLETHFIQSSDVVPFLDIIEKLSLEVGAKTEIISVDVKDSSSLVVEVEALGNFETIYKLVLLLENSPYNLEFVLVDIQNSNPQNVSISKSNKNQQWMATFKIKLLSFVN